MYPYTHTHVRARAYPYVHTHTRHFVVPTFVLFPIFVLFRTLHFSRSLFPLTQTTPDSRTPRGTTPNHLSGDLLVKTSTWESSTEVPDPLGRRPTRRRDGRTSWNPLNERRKEQSKRRDILSIRIVTGVLLHKSPNLVYYLHFIVLTTTVNYPQSNNRPLTPSSPLSREYRLSDPCGRITVPV